MTTKEEAQRYMDSIINHLRRDESVPSSMLGEAFDVRRYLDGSGDLSNDPANEQLINLQGYNPTAREIIALKHIYNTGSASTAELMSATGLSRATVATFMNTLASLNIVDKGRDSRESRYTISNEKTVKKLLERYGKLADSQ